MDADGLKIALLKALIWVLYLALLVTILLPHLVAQYTVRPLIGRAADWLGVDAYRLRRHSYRTERLLDWWSFDLYTRRVYSPCDRNGPHGSLDGLPVELGGGFGPVRFGMSPRQVEEAFGRSLGYDAWDDGNLNDSLIYNGVRFFFDSCDMRGPLAKSRLHKAEIRRPDAILFDRPLADWGEAELAAELARRGVRIQRSEPGYVETESFGLAGSFEGGRLAWVVVAE